MMKLAILLGFVAILARVSNGQVLKMPTVEDCLDLDSNVALYSRIKKPFYLVSESVTLLEDTYSKNIS